MIMEIIRDIRELPARLRGGVIAIGNFDGLHRGHIQVLNTMLSGAERKKALPAVLTFEPHPRMYFKKTDMPLRVEPFHVKAKRLQAMGVKAVYVLRFNQAFSELGHEAFARDILHEKLAASHIVTGENFVFGHKRLGTTEYLRQLSKEGLFGYEAVSPKLVRGEPCSSSRIRQLLQEGKVREASDLLGRPYEIFARIRRGAGRGKGLGYPTLNIQLEHLFPPRFGVYAVRVAIGQSVEDEANENWLPGVANWGFRPTFDGKEKVFETHLLQGEAPDYGARIKVRLEGYIREEKKFDDAEALVRQISKDTETAQRMLELV